MRVSNGCNVSTYAGFVQDEEVSGPPAKRPSNVAVLPQAHTGNTVTGQILVSKIQ